MKESPYEKCFSAESMRCENCRFWQRFGIGDEREGFCKRFPPQLNTAYLYFNEKWADAKHRDGADMTIDACNSFIPWFHPTIEYDDWCGEFQQIRHGS